MTQYDLMHEPTCDPALRSWVDSANDPGTDFPVQNLPFGIFQTQKNGARIGVAIGEQIVDLCGLAKDGDLAGIDLATSEACRQETLNALMALGRPRLSALRARLSELLREGAAEQAKVEQHLVAQSDAEMLLPATIGDYTDFYASIDHATRVGSILRPEKPLLPNYKHIPIGYHGRASSIVVSGTGVRRPWGQQLAGEQPVFAPTQRMDYEVELGLFIGAGNKLGEPVKLREATQHMFGCCLVNDWSARDTQAWEYQPLGPFLSKSFATSISPWVVTLDALTPFRTRPRQRASGDPEVLEYLASAETDDAFDIQLEMRIQTEAMREAKLPPALVSHSNVRDLYWLLSQLLTHHASGGCNLRPGDLLATGTVSGEAETARGCLLELTKGGAVPVELPNGERRTYLQDGDEVILSGYCEREGARRIGFGECRGRVVAAIA